MALSTKTSKMSSKKSKIAELRKKHEPLFKKEGDEKATFVPKWAYNEHSVGEKIIAFFPSEIKGGKDIYTEFVSQDYVPEDPERTLYKWEFNPHYEDEYSKSDPHPTTGDCRIYIPVNELINVAELHLESPEEVQKVEQNAEEAFPLMDPKRDAPIKELTIKDKCAIDWRRPVSDKPWLNELIKEEFKR